MIFAIVPDRREHWESIYGSRSDAEVSWTQSEPRLSLELIGELRPPPARVLDVGGGSSALAGCLLQRGYIVGVLDISEAALERARGTLGARAGDVEWIVADVSAVGDVGRFDVWHDRAVFHFLTDQADRQAYAALAARTILPGGHAVIATFAPDGPARCSGLEVRRYDGPMLARELGSSFRLLRSVDEMHHTPSGAEQAFQYSVFQRVAVE